MVEVCLKSILLSLFICSVALADWNTEAWSGDYWRYTTDGQPTSYLIKSNALEALAERQLAVGFGMSTNDVTTFYRDVPFTDNMALSEMKFFLKQIIDDFIDIDLTSTTNIVYHTITGLCEKVGIETNYFDYTPPRFLYVPTNSASFYPTNSSTVGSSTMANYGWYYIKPIMEELVATDGTGGGATYKGNSYSYTIGGSIGSYSYYTWDGDCLCGRPSVMNNFGTSISTNTTAVLTTDATGVNLSNIFDSSQDNLAYWKHNQFDASGTDCTWTYGGNSGSGNDLSYSVATNITTTASARNTNVNSSAVIYWKFQQPNASQDSFIKDLVAGTVGADYPSLDDGANCEEGDEWPLSFALGGNSNLVGSATNLPSYSVWGGVTNLTAMVDAQSGSETNATTDGSFDFSLALSPTVKIFEVEDSVTDSDAQGTDTQIQKLHSYTLPPFDIKQNGAQVIIYYNVTDGFDYQ